MEMGVGQQTDQRLPAGQCAARGAFDGILGTEVARFDCGKSRRVEVGGGESTLWLDLVPFCLSRWHSGRVGGSLEITANVTNTVECLALDFTARKASKSDNLPLQVIAMGARVIAIPVLCNMRACVPPACLAMGSSTMSAPSHCSRVSRVNLLLSLCPNSAHRAHRL